MRVLESIPTVHTEGVIYVDLNVAKQPVFTIGLHVHDSISAAGGNPKLEPHPVQSRLLRGRSALEEIPVRVLFDEARSNILGRYEAWGESPGQGPQCIGNGECAKRYDQESNAWVQTPCRGPSLCPIPANQGVNCSLRTKVILQIVDEGEELGAFEFRSSGESTYRAMLGSLQALQAKHGHPIVGWGFILQGWAWFGIALGVAVTAFVCAGSSANRPFYRCGHHGGKGTSRLTGRAATSFKYRRVYARESCFATRSTFLRCIC